MDQVPDSTVGSDGDEQPQGPTASSPQGEPVRVAPKLFLKAMPGGTFTSSSSSHVISSTPPTPTTAPSPVNSSFTVKQRAPLPQLTPRPQQGMGKRLPSSSPSQGGVGGLTITRVPPAVVQKIGKISSEDVSASDATSTPYLPTTRFLSGRNFLKPRKSLPALTPIGGGGGGTFKKTLPLPTSTLQARPGPTGISMTITKSPNSPQKVHRFTNSTPGTGMERKVSMTNSQLSQNSNRISMQLNTKGIAHPIQSTGKPLNLQMLKPTVTGTTSPSVKPNAQSANLSAEGIANKVPKQNVKLGTPPPKPNAQLFKNNFLQRSPIKGSPVSLVRGNNIPVSVGGIVKRAPPQPKANVPNLIGGVHPLLKANAQGEFSNVGKIRQVKPRMSSPVSRFTSPAGELKIQRSFETAAMSVTCISDVNSKLSPAVSSNNSSPSAENPQHASTTNNINSPAQVPCEVLTDPPKQIKNQTQVTSDVLVKQKIVQKEETSKPPVRMEEEEEDDDQDDEDMEVDSESESPKEAQPEINDDDNDDAKCMEENSQENDGTNRRTGRRRKPTKHFMTDMVVTPSRRRRDNNNTNLEETEDQVEMISSSDANTTGSENIVGERVMKTRGRPRGTGRGRGRPRGARGGTSRGSSIRVKLEREKINMSSESLEADWNNEDVHMKSNNLNDSDLQMEESPTKDSKDNEDENSEENESNELSPSPNITFSPTRGRGRGRGSRGGATRGSPITPRGSRRGGRGSRGGRGARKILMAKRRADAKAAKALILAAAKEQAPEVFEEETRMSADIKSEKLSNNLYPSTPNVDDDASNVSSTSASTNTVKIKKFTKDFVDDRKPVTAETLFEYQWPQNNPEADFYFLQEQIIEFLGHKSFRRKYPNLRRRCVEMEERDFLREQKIVSETQCDLGLTAINSSEVLDILYSDFPEKYEEYRKFEVDRKEKELTRSQASNNNNNTTTNTRDRSAEFMRRITKSCSNWNANFNRDRKESRSFCFDLQTCTINVPAGTMKVLPPECTKLGYFPVSVLPGQYSDSFQKYTPQELNYLPLNTVMYGPIKENRTAEESDESDSDSDGSSSSDETSSSSSDEDGSDNEGNTEGMNGDVISVVDPKDTQGICKTCNSDYYKNKDGRSEILIHCTKCDSANHPTCLELSLDMVPYIKKYQWQCTDCKNCIECNDPADEDKMLFCDCCDRGYHIYCVGLRKVPTGRWHCVTCSVCHSCGAVEPSPDDRTAEWHHEYKKGEKGAKFFLHSLCVSCHKVFKKGQYCPSCLKCHIKLDDKSLLECRNCEKWVHKHCVKRTLQAKFGFICDHCDSASFTARTKLPPGRRN